MRERGGEGEGDCVRRREEGKERKRERMVSSPVEPRENPPHHKDHSRMTEERKKLLKQVTDMPCLINNAMQVLEQMYH